MLLKFCLVAEQIFVEISGVEISGVENSGVENSGGKNPVWGIYRGGKSVRGIFRGGIFSVGKIGIFSVGKIPGGKKVGGEYSWWGIFRGGINRGGTFRGEFSGGEIAGHPICNIKKTIISQVLLRRSTVCNINVHIDMSFLNLVITNRSKIVFTISRLISVLCNMIQKRFFCV